MSNITRKKMVKGKSGLLLIIPDTDGQDTTFIIKRFHEASLESDMPFLMLYKGYVVQEIEENSASYAYTDVQLYSSVKVDFFSKKPADPKSAYWTYGRVLKDLFEKLSEYEHSWRVFVLGHGTLNRFDGVTMCAMDKNEFGELEIFLKDYETKRIEVVIFFSCFLGGEVARTLLPSVYNFPIIVPSFREASVSSRPAVPDYSVLLNPNATIAKMVYELILSSFILWKFTKGPYEEEVVFQWPMLKRSGKKEFEMWDISGTDTKGMVMFGIEQRVVVDSRVHVLVLMLENYESINIIDNDKELKIYSGITGNITHTIKSFIVEGGIKRELKDYFGHKTACISVKKFVVNGIQLYSYPDNSGKQQLFEIGTDDSLDAHLKYGGLYVFNISPDPISFLTDKYRREYFKYIVSKEIVLSKGFLDSMHSAGFIGIVKEDAFVMLQTERYMPHDNLEFKTTIIYEGGGKKAYLGVYKEVDDFLDKRQRELLEKRDVSQRNLYNAPKHLVDTYEGIQNCRTPLEPDEERRICILSETPLPERFNAYTDTTKIIIVAAFSTVPNSRFVSIGSMFEGMSHENESNYGNLLKMIFHFVKNIYHPTAESAFLLVSDRITKLLSVELGGQIRTIKKDDNIYLPYIKKAYHPLYSNSETDYDTLVYLGNRFLHRIHSRELYRFVQGIQKHREWYCTVGHKEHFKYRYKSAELLSEYPIVLGKFLRMYRGNLDSDGFSEKEEYVFFMESNEHFTEEQKILDKFFKENVIAFPIGDDKTLKVGSFGDFSYHVYLCYAIVESEETRTAFFIKNLSFETFLENNLSSLKDSSSTKKTSG